MPSSSPPLYRGSCLCGAVEYEVTSDITTVSHCHCAMCRKAHGAAFATYGSVLREHYCLVANPMAVRTYPSSSSVTRTFCATCGAPMCWQSEGAYAHFTSFPLGSLDTPYRAPAHQHIHVASKAPWFDITDAWPQAAEY